MAKKPLLVAFSTQKGGIGKSALTVLMASYFHYEKGYNVGIIDCDYPQYSVYHMRQRDREIVETVDYYKLKAYNQFRSLGKRNYPVEKSPAPGAVAAANRMIEEYADMEFDIIFFDLPGTLNSEGILQTLASLDYIFSPVSADRMVLHSTLEFVSLINESIISQGKGNIQGLYLLWNMVDAREKPDLYEAYEKVITELGLTVMKSSLPDTKRYRHELTGEIAPVFRSTLFPADKRLIKGGRLDVLADEMEELIKIKEYGGKKDEIKKVEDIDERELLSFMDKPKPPPKEEPVREETRELLEKEETTERDDKPQKVSRRKRSEEYLEPFLRPQELQQRQCVYISAKAHASISKIVKRLNIKNLTVGVYIDTVLRQHFDAHRDELNAIYRRVEDDLFEE